METQPGIIEISQDRKVLMVKQAMLDNSTFNDVSAKNVKITDANLSDLEIEGAQIGGAYIHNIGMPPKGHPMYNPHARQRPVRFEDCDLNNSIFTNCSLENVSINNCDISGLKINGIDIDSLLQNYKQ